MSATESSTAILRRLLDERGVEYDGRLLYETEWTVNGITLHAKECDGMLNVYVRNNDLMLTPEQAIAAALGGDECEFVIEDNMNESEGMGDVWFHCTNCDTKFDYYADDWLMKQNYCPHCGFKIRKAVRR